MPGRVKIGTKGENNTIVLVKVFDKHYSIIYIYIHREILSQFMLGNQSEKIASYFEIVNNKIYKTVVCKRIFKFKLLTTIR